MYLQRDGKRLSIQRSLSRGGSRGDKQFVTCSHHIGGNLADAPSVTLLEQQDYEVKLVTRPTDTSRVTACAH